MKCPQPPILKFYTTILKICHVLRRILVWLQLSLLPVATAVFFPPLPPQGRLCLHNDFDGTEHVFTLRRVGEPPLPLDHIVLSCPVGKTTYAKLDIPNYTQKTLTLRVQTPSAHTAGVLHTLAKV